MPKFKFNMKLEINNLNAKQLRAESLKKQLSIIQLTQTNEPEIGKFALQWDKLNII